MYVNILGFGITNKAIMQLLNHNNILCKVYDQCFLEYSEDSIGNKYIPFEACKNMDKDYTLTIISPGIPPNNKYLMYFTNIISEYDFIYHFLDTFSSIWISGTNGKTTTTEMTSLMLNAKSGGNIGTPLAELFMQDYKEKSITQELLKQIAHSSNIQQEVYNPTKWEDSKIKWVLETSSFALHYTRFALPNLYILLPLSQDHISWHGSYENYIKDKLKPLVSMQYAKNAKDHFALLPKDILQFRVAAQILNNTSVNVFFYQESQELFSFLQCDHSYYDIFKDPFRLDFLVTASAMKFSAIPFQIENIKNYKIGEHRMEEKEYNGILFVNDSKATNPHATLSALRAYKEYTIYLILGGDLKGATLSLIYPFLQENNIKVFCIGKDGMQIYKECLEHTINATECTTLFKALQEIKLQLHKDRNDLLENKNSLSTQKTINTETQNAIILSPACASLDQYTSYKARGQEFRKLVEEIF